MSINTFPINTVSPTANLIINTPSGSISATDVQTAINQLAALIPAVGPGTDPLALVNGLTVTAINPHVDNVPSDQKAVKIDCKFDCSNVTPSFANVGAFEVVGQFMHGQGTYNAVSQIKETMLAQSTYCAYVGSGQRFLYNNRIDSWGMGDVGITGGNNITVAGGPIDGDEGIGWQPVSNITQQRFLAITTITSVPTKSLVNTTTTQSITASTAPQTVTVASTTGAIVGDWVVIDQEAPTSGQNEEAVQITAFSPTSITGIFRCNHNSGCTVTPALRLVLDSVYTIGQDRIIINLSQPSYSTGNITSISGGGWTGTGTNFTNGMVGGYNLNVGAISLDADTYTGDPYNGTGLSGPLRSWYQIRSVTSTTVLSVFTTSVAGDGAYHGFGPPPGGKGTAGSYPYIIRPCAKVLRVVTDANLNQTKELILETSTSTWSVGDTIEQVMCPYPDVSGYQYALNFFTPGGTYRDFMSIRNGGARAFQTCFRIWDAGPIYTSGDGYTFNTILSIESTVNHIIDANQGHCKVAAIRLSGQAPATDGAIIWGPTLDHSAGFSVNETNQGLTINGIQGYTAPSGQLIFANSNCGINFETNQILARFNGYIQIVPMGSGNQMLQLVNLDGATNFEHGFFRWKSNDLEIGTEKGGSGTARDMIVKTNGVEQLRFLAGDKLKFSGSASFSANGSVATTLGSVGPTGASTTVQKWLTFQDNTGATRYIPCF